MLDMCLNHVILVLQISATVMVTVLPVPYYVPDSFYDIVFDTYVLPMPV